MDNKIKHEIIVLSDIHLGSPLLNTEATINFLKSIEVKYLVLNGDVFDDPKRVFRLKKQHWSVLAQLRKMSDHCECIWVRGNHDSLGIDKSMDMKALSNLLGIKFKRELFIEINGMKIVMLHGDRFDGLLYKHPIMNNIVTWIYDRLKEIKFEWSKSIVRYIKRRSKILMRNNNYVMEGAFRYIEETNSSLGICGHTHHAELIKKENSIYANCGAFENSTQTFIGIDEDKIGLYSWDGKTSTLIRELPFYIHS